MKDKPRWQVVHGAVQRGRFGDITDGELASIVAGDRFREEEEKLKAQRGGHFPVEASMNLRNNVLSKLYGDWNRGETNRAALVEEIRSRRTS